MTDTLKLYHLAQLAEASYAMFNEFSSDETYTHTEVKNALIAQDGEDYNFSPTQATYFVENWQVVHHQPNTTSGYSARAVRPICLYGDAGNDRLYGEKGNDTECRLVA